MRLEKREKKKEKLELQKKLRMKELKKRKNYYL
jgi:hypothetical protein